MCLRHIDSLDTDYEWKMWQGGAIFQVTKERPAQTNNNAVSTVNAAAPVLRLHVLYII